MGEEILATYLFTMFMLMKFSGYRLTQNPAEAKQPESKKRHSYTKELK